VDTNVPEENTEIRRCLRTETLLFTHQTTRSHNCKCGSRNANVRPAKLQEQTASQLTQYTSLICEGFRTDGFQGKDPAICVGIKDLVIFSYFMTMF
jgi:hypothetical protein